MIASSSFVLWLLTVLGLTAPPSTVPCPPPQSANATTEVCPANLAHEVQPAGKSGIWNGF